MKSQIILSRKGVFLTFLLSLVFFVLAFYTISNYNVSWDEAIHFRRGQAYLHYFLTGNRNYSSLPNTNLQGTNGDPKKVPFPRRSYYQNDFHTAEYFLANDVGHPPLNDYAAAFLNYIFFQKLGVMGDIESHHLFNVLTSTLLVFIVVAFSYASYGAFASLVSFLVLVTYPLFWSESHFNIKDPPQAAFFSLFLFSFYTSLKKGSSIWLLASIAAFTISLGIKFNILFAPLLVTTYLLTSKSRINKKKFGRTYFWLLLLSPVVITSFLVISWPFIQGNFPHNFFKIFLYYKEIGTGVAYQPQEYYIFGINLFPLLWFLFTTPPYILLLLAIGIVSILANFTKNKKEVVFLWLIWFLFPFIRVMLPGTVVYGGIRQIFEFIPAMALLAGYSANKFFKTSNLRVIVLILFFWPVYSLVRLHPHENLYFNFLVGGVKGAQSINFPSWGNTFGNAYKDGIKWININAEIGAKIALLQGTPANAPLIYFRSDLNYANENFSGIDRKGEYIMELIYNDTGKNFFYAWEYVDKFLIPVHEVKVDEVTILRIWKNDLEHTKQHYRMNSSPYKKQFNVEKQENSLNISFKEKVILSDIKLSYLENDNCKSPTIMFVEWTENKEYWYRELDWIPQYQINYQLNKNGNKIKYFFAAREANSIRIVPSEEDSCIFNKPQIEVTTLK